MIFTVEEVNLVKAFDHTTRMMAIFDMKSSIPTIENEELRELCEKTLQKVSDMTDDEFAAIDFTVYEEGDADE